MKYFLLLLLICSSVYAQDVKPEDLSVEFFGDIGLSVHGGRNGGDGGEIEIRLIAKKILKFLGTEKGEAIFPEINHSYLKEKVHQSKFLPSSSVLIDKFGTERTCLNQGSVNEVVCNRSRWDSIKDIRVKYILILHEMLGLIDVELGYRENVSMYPISMRIHTYVLEIDNNIANSDVNYDSSYIVGKTIINKKTKEKLMLVCESIVDGDCIQYSLIKKLKEESLIVLKIENESELASFATRLAKLRDNPYVEKRELRVIQILLDILNNRDSLYMSKVTQKVKNKDYKNIESLIQVIARGR